MDIAAAQAAPQPTLFGHPTGLFTLFFAEMWERFSFYGMKALLVFYMTKDFLGYGDKQAYAVYGAYTSLVYMTPFFGGIIADRLLGQRRAVILGGLLMAAGHLMMSVPHRLGFYTALALLICGNGFFKPNISTIVGSLYPPGSTRRDAGFTLFYMGINLGAAIAPLLCGYVGETYGWHYGFGLATIGMLTGLAVFVMPTLITQLLIMTGAMAAAFGLFYYHPSSPYVIAANTFVGVSVLLAAIFAWIALNRGGLPTSTGAPPDADRLRKPFIGPITAEWTVYLGTLATLPIFVLLVSGFAVFQRFGSGVTIIPDSMVHGLQSSTHAAFRVLAVVLQESSRPAGLMVMLAGIGGGAFILMETFRLDRIGRQRMLVVLILTFFSMLFWAFFEQAGSSVNNFTDRNVDRVFQTRTIQPADVGTTIRIQPTQEQLGLHNGEVVFTLDKLDKLRSEHKDETRFQVDWTVAGDNVGMGVAQRLQEIPASTLLSVNSIYILVFGLAFTALWACLGKLGMEPSAPVKFSLGLLQLGLGFGAFWYGANHADMRGMVGIGWLLLGYLLHTTGELCVSPVGLSMVSRLAPARLVATVMGIWFLATAFSQFLAAIIAQFTGVHEEAGSAMTIPPPSQTVGVYGEVFGQIALAAIIAAGICLLLSPLLTRWMHEGKDGPDAVA